jgi:squalene cyclase
MEKYHRGWIMDAQKAIAFVNEKGSDLEISRLRTILFAGEPEIDVVQPFLALQSSRGGFPLRMQAGNPETVDNTLTALWWLDELGMLDAPVGQKALGFLLAVQKEDGGWDEDVSLERDELPPWIQPGDLNTRLYLSAYASYWLCAGGYKSEPVIKRAMAFLLPYQQESGRFLGYLHTTWIAASACLLAGQTEPASRSIQALLDWPIADWEASQMAWALDCLHRGGIERNHALVEKLLAKLEASQGPEGQWASEDGESFAVSTTIEVLKVFKLYDQLPGTLT